MIPEYHHNMGRLDQTDENSKTQIPGDGKFTVHNRLLGPRPRTLSLIMHESWINRTKGIKNQAPKFASAVY